jgi:hypothetical protein
MSPPTVPPPGFSELSTEETIAYVQALWDLIVANPADVPVDDGQLAILKERLPAARDPGRPHVPGPRSAPSSRRAWAQCTGSAKRGGQTERAGQVIVELAPESATPDDVVAAAQSLGPR